MTMNHLLFWLDLHVEFIRFGKRSGASKERIVFGVIQVRVIIFRDQLPPRNASVNRVSNLVVPKRNLFDYCFEHVHLRLLVDDRYT